MASRPIFFASGVFFLLDNVTEPLRSWLCWNPLIHGVGLVRAGFYPTYDATYASLAYGYSFGLIALVLGLIQLRANHDRILLQPITFARGAFTDRPHPLPIT